MSDNNRFKYIIHEHELTLYPYASAGLLHNQGVWPPTKYQFSIMSYVSTDNDDNIISWIIYHKEIGINHIYLYCCDDDPVELYQKIFPFTMGKYPFVTFVHYRFKNAQKQAYFHFVHNYIHETEWHIRIDSQDFIFLNQNKNLSQFIDDFSEANAIYFNIKNNEQKSFNSETNIFKYEKESIRIMIRNHSFPYQDYFKKITDTSEYCINYFSHTLIIYNVLKDNMKEYLNKSEDELKNILERPEKQYKILNTAYIMHNNEGLFNHNDNLQLKYKALQIISAIKKCCIIPSNTYTLLSHKKPCDQSSAPNNIPTQELAKNLVTGTFKGVSQSKTLSEDTPWWIIDLTQYHIIHQIMLFNTLNNDMRNMIHFEIASSEDNENWIIRHQKTSDDIFGGINGTPYIWSHPLGFRARWIKITIPGTNKIFSLDQIQIFGKLL